MKYIKRFENKYTFLYNIYQSGTFSQHDDNIDDLISQVIFLKEKNIEYYVIKTNEPVIHFRIFCFPKNDNEEYILFNNKNFFKFIDYGTRKMKSHQDYKDYFKNKSLKVDITKENIDMIYQVNKYNL